MDETPQRRIDAWQWLPKDVGLYLGVYEGGLTTRTSFVDRGLSPVDQIRQLASLDWLPSGVAERTLASLLDPKEVLPEQLPQVTPGRWLAPETFELSALVPPTVGAPSGLRSYLWPLVDFQTKLLLRQGEVIQKTKNEMRESEFRQAADIKRYLTNERLVLTAGLETPILVREDQNLALSLVPVVGDAVALFRGTRRAMHTPSLRWVKHVRFEWIHSIEKLTTVSRDKKMLSRELKGPERIHTWYRAKVRLPNGASYLEDLWQFRDDEIERLRKPDKLAGEVRDFEQLLFGSLEKLSISVHRGAPERRHITTGTVQSEIFLLDEQAAVSLQSW